MTLTIYLLLISITIKLIIMFYRKRIEVKLAELEARVDALEMVVKKLSSDSSDMDRNIAALWNLYREKMFKPEQEQKPKPKRRRAKKNGKGSGSAE